MCVMSGLVIVILVILVVFAVMAAGGLLGVFDRYQRPVRCSAGHLFTTIWVPLGSIKAVRLGPRRWQHCPVGHHWATIERLDPSTAAPADLQAAAAVHDVHVP